MTSSTNVLWWLKDNKVKRAEHGADAFANRDRSVAKSSLSPLCSRHNGVHHLDDSVQSGVGADRHVSSTEVVIDGAHHPHDVKGRVLLNRVGFDRA